MLNTPNLPGGHSIRVRARALAADKACILLRDLKSSADPLWLEDDFGLPPQQGDLPLLLRFAIHPDDLRPFGLPADLSRHQRIVVAYILAEAALATLDGRGLSYSRRRDWYSHRPFYFGPACTYRGIVPTADALDRIGLVSHYRATPGDHLRTGLQSRLWLAEDVLASMMECRIILHPMHNPLMLRARNKNRDLMRYIDNNHTRFLRKQMQRINDHIRGARLRGGDGKVIAPQYCRIFSDSLEKGGRLYTGPQNLPKDERKQISIDGSATAEADFDELHARLLYLQDGITPEPDAYEIDCYERREVKVGTFIMWNAPNWPSGLRAIARHIFEPPLHEGGAGKHERPSEVSFEKARKLAAAIKSKHRRIARYFCSDAGVWLQRRDSDIAADTHELCMADDIPVLSIYDSCRAPIGDIGRVCHHMAAAFRRQTGLSACSISIN